MYIFHRTSEEKLHIEAPLLVESWNFISTFKSRMNKNKKEKGKYPNTRGNSETLFSSECLREPRLLYKWPPCEPGRAAPPTHGIQGSNTANVQSVWHRQTSCPSAPALHAAPSHSTRKEGVPGPERSALVDHFIDGGLLVTGASHDVFVVRRDVAAEHGRGFLGLRKRRVGRGKKR